MTKRRHRNPAAAQQAAMEKPRANRIVALAALLLSLATIAVYSNSFSGPFIFDDAPSIVANPTIRSLWPPWPALFSADYATVVGRPLLNLSLAVNYALGGENVWGYHFFNLALHIAAALALFGLLRRVFAFPALRRANAAFPPTGLAFASALLWAVHPLQTESVTYIVQRAESLAGLFFLLAFYALARAADSPRPGAWSAAVVAAHLLCVASKETAVAAPPLLLLFDWLFIAGSWRTALSRRRWMYAGLAVNCVLLAGLVLSSGGRAGTAGFGFGMSAWEYARLQLAVVPRYIRLCLWPSPMVLDYGSSFPAAGWQLAAGAVVLAILVGGAIVALARRLPAGFAGAWFFAILAPTSTVAPLVTQVAAEHRMYLPLAAVTALVVAGFACASRTLRRLAPVALAAAAVALGWATLARNADYRSTVAIWQDTAEKWPTNPRALTNYGAAMAALGKAAEAVASFNRAVELAPADPEVYYNRGKALADIGSWEASLADYNRAIELRADFPEAYSNRGDLHRRRGRHEQALADYAEALRLNPDLAPALVGRAQSLLALKRTAQARQDVARLRELGVETPAKFLDALDKAEESAP